MSSELFFAFLPGAAQGLTTVLLGHPFDTAKTRMQALGPTASRSLLQTMRNITRGEGITGLYRAASMPLIMSTTKRSLQFAIWNAFQEERQNSQKMFSSTFLLQQNNIFSWAKECVGASSFLSGAVAGGVGTIIGCPMHVIKIKTQFSTRTVTKNVWACAVDIYNTDRFRGYYCGFRQHLLRDVFFSGCYLGLYDKIKRWLCKQYMEPVEASHGPGVTAASRKNKTGYSATQLAFFAGSFSSAATWTIMYPLDTIKTIIQARNVSFAQVVDIFIKEPSIMYRGLGASLVRAGPICGVAMVVYEYTKEKTHRLQQQQYKSDIVKDDGDDKKQKTAGLEALVEYR